MVNYNLITMDFSMAGPDGGEMLFPLNYILFIPILLQISMQNIIDV